MEKLTAIKKKGLLTYPEYVGKIHPEAGQRMTWTVTALAGIMDTLEIVRPTSEMDEKYRNFIRSIFDKVNGAMAFLMVPKRELLEEMSKTIDSGEAFTNWMQMKDHTRWTKKMRPGKGKRQD